MPLQSSFLFAVCQAGAEKALKEELAREHPSLRFAFSRPGFLTFKSSGGPLAEDFELRSVFARAYGLSFGKAGDPAAAPLLSSEEPFRLHVFERDQHEPGEEPKGFVEGAWVKQASDRLRSDLRPGLLLEGEVASGSDLVLDAVCVDENETWVGAHRHSSAHSPVAGGKWKIVLPEEAPSRAYLKLEEALEWSQLPIRKGDQAVEIGSAPGGASYALLKRGVHVVGIDPGKMDPQVLRFRGLAGQPKFVHFETPVANVLREDLPESVEWLLADMNVEPRITMAAVDRLGSRLSEGLLGMVLTLKLNQWSFAKEIPAWLEHVKAMGMARVRATQLAHNRREICVYGLTRKGMARTRPG